MKIKNGTIVCKIVLLEYYRKKNYVAYYPYGENLHAPLKIKQFIGIIQYILMGYS